MDEVDLRILVALGERPLGDYKWLSNRVAISYSTLLKKLSKLVDSNILWGQGYVSAQINYSSVGLEFVAIFIEAMLENWTKIEKVCDLHPYIRYRIRCLGSVNGFLALFAVPVGTVSLLLRFLDELIKAGIIVKYSLHTPMNRWAYTEYNFNFYDIESGTWKFDWNNWQKSIEDTPAPPLRKYPPSVLSQMNEEDMQILRQLSINARMERKIIAKTVGIPPYQLSRRLRFYAENQVIDAYRIIFGSAILGLTTSALFECRDSVSVTEKFALAVPKLPFQSTFFPTQNGFILYVAIPASDFPIIATILQKYCSSVKIMWCDYSASMRYWFNDAPGSFRCGEWVSSREFMVTDVLDKLLK